MESCISGFCRCFHPRTHCGISTFCSRSGIQHFMELSSDHLLPSSVSNTSARVFGDRMEITSQPFLPARILYQPSLFAWSICNLLANVGWLGITYYLPLYWQAAECLSATQTGLRLLPGTVAGVAGSLLAGWKMRRKGSYCSFTVIAYSICVLGVIPIMLFTGLISHNI